MRGPAIILGTVAFLMAAGVIVSKVARLESEVLEAQALDHAALMSRILEAFRTLYTSEVVASAVESGMKITHDYRGKKGAIPLPATLTMLLGERISGQGTGGTARLYSPYPFPWRRAGAGAAQDAFAEEAWQALTRDPSRPFHRFDVSRDQTMLRFAVADRMRPSCVSCHNTHPSSPKTDWQVGDVRGVLEVGFPVRSAALMGGRVLREVAHLLGIMGSLAFVGVAVVILRLRRAGATAMMARDEAESALAEKTQAEQRYRALFESAPDSMINVDSDGNILFVNAQAEAMFGYSRTELVGQPVEILVPERVRGQHVGHRMRWASAGPQRRRPMGSVANFRGQRKDGREFPAEISLSVSANEERPVVTIIVRDISARKALEADLVQAQKLESIGQLAAGIAHEINTPTQYVGDNVRFLQDAFESLREVLAHHEQLLAVAQENGIAPELVRATEAATAEADVAYLLDEIPRAVAQSLEGVTRVAKIVGAMKEFSHPGSEGKQPIDLTRALETTITVARNEWKYVAEMVTDFAPDLPPVPCLPGELNQVILNLIVNAAHAIADVVGDGAGGKGTITVRTRQDGAWVEIHITDTGPGIPADIRARIFDPFFTTKEVGKGTGQGLAIARSVVVDKHGGTLTCESAPGAGTTFLIRLPLEAPETATLPTAADATV